MVLCKYRNRVWYIKSRADTRQRQMKHVVNTERLPPESDDINRAEQYEKESQLDPWETNRHGESSESSRRSKFQSADELCPNRVWLFLKYIGGSLTKEKALGVSVCHQKRKKFIQIFFCWTHLNAQEKLVKMLLETCPPLKVRLTWSLSLCSIYMLSKHCDTR